eukprot:2881420-Prymnesium_polylepis.1
MLYWPRRTIHISRASRHSLFEVGHAVMASGSGAGARVAPRTQALLFAARRARRRGNLHGCCAGGWHGRGRV